MAALIGRKNEIETLNGYYHSGKSEFIVVYGRRRVGKTFLIKQLFKNKLLFQHTAIANANGKTQLSNFYNSLYECGFQPEAPLKDWFDAFQQLKSFLQQKSSSERQLIFIDELPWLDTPKMNFVSALEHFWNSWAAWEDNIMLIVCGSATSWMTNNIINNHGGLHNRLTHSLYLAPFSLGECEEYCQSRNIIWSRKYIAECYMVMGGIPYYLDQIEKGESLSQCIDRLFFLPNAMLKTEFNNLYKSLFKHSENYIKVITQLGKVRAGLTRQELIKNTGLADGKGISVILKDLELCDFIQKYPEFGKAKSKSKYQLIDFYTLFYLLFVEKNKQNDTHFWSNSLLSPLHNSWAGLTFELLCKYHIKQIKQKLGIYGIVSQQYTWYNNQKDGVQIDLLIDRADHCINIIEIKFAKEQFEINQEYETKLNHKIDRFIRDTATRKTPILTFLTTYGIKQNAHSSIVQKEIVLDDLFL